MKGKGLYEEYCDTFPMIQGYRELKYTEWLENELLKLREEVNKNCNAPAVSESVCGLGMKTCECERYSEVKTCKHCPWEQTVC
jgi:hypothetical protein